MYSLSTLAQVANQELNINILKSNSSKLVSSINEPFIPKNSTAAAPLNPFWTSDFSNPADWVLDNTGSFTNEGWNIDGTTDSWYLPNFTSSSGGNFAELGNGDPNATGWNGPIQVEYTLTTANPIDVYSSIGSSNATLSFEEFGARFNDLQAIQISTDGVHFTTVADNLNYTVTSLSAGSNPYPNPSLREISLASFLGTMPTSVWIRFSWTTNYPNQATNPNVWITYGWMVDDVALTETAPYVMDVVDQNHGGWDIGYLSTSGVGMDYTFKPQVQSDANPYMFEMTIANVGAQPLNGIQMNVEVLNSAGVSVFNSSSSPTTLAVFDTASYLATQTYAPLSQGVYDMNFWGSSDSILTTDISEMMAVITDSVYGRDNNDPAGAWRVGRICGGLQLANKFDVYAADEATSVSAYVADYSVVGADMYAVLYEVDTTGTSTAYIPLDQTDDYTIQPADRDNWVTIGFNQANNLIPGMYMVAIGGYVHPVDTFGINVSGSAEPTMSMIYDDGNGCDLNPQTTPPIWLWIYDTPMIRLNFGNSSVSNINENTFNGTLSIYPNPSNGVFTISLHENESYDVTISNLLGQTIYITTTSAMESIIDLSSFDKGIYTVELRNENKTFTKKVIIE